MKLALAFSACFALLPLAFVSAAMGADPSIDAATPASQEAPPAQLPQAFFGEDPCVALCQAIITAQNVKEIKINLRNLARVRRDEAQTALGDAEDAVNLFTIKVQGLQELLDRATLSGNQAAINQAAERLNTAQGLLATAEAKKATAEGQLTAAQEVLDQANEDLATACAALMAANEAAADCH